MAANVRVQKQENAQECVYHASKTAPVKHRSQAWPMPVKHRDICTEMLLVSWSIDNQFKWLKTIVGHDLAKGTCAWRGKQQLHDVDVNINRTCLCSS